MSCRATAEVIVWRRCERPGNEGKIARTRPTARTVCVGTATNANLWHTHIVTARRWTDIDRDREWRISRNSGGAGRYARRVRVKMTPKLRDSGRWQQHSARKSQNYRGVKNGGIAENS